MFKKIAACILSLFMAASLLPLSVFADTNSTTSGTTGDCTWTLNGTVLTISGNGEMGNSAPWGKEISRVIIETGVTNISESAFSNCTGLTSIYLPNSIKSIGKYAFSNCTGLTYIRIPDSVTEINYAAFSGCTGLTDITLPDGITKIYKSAFYNTAYYNNESNWKNGVLYISNYLIEAKKDLFGHCIIKNGTKNIADSAFENCDKLLYAELPDSVTDIGISAFERCTKLTEVKLSNNITCISDRAFSGCKNLTDIKIPDSVTNIGAKAFYGCLQLTDITIPDSVTSIGQYAFSCCDSLTSVVIPNSVTGIGQYAYSNSDSLTSIAISNGITSIGDLAFSSCKSLTSINIPNSVTSIGNSAFSYCTSLTSVVIPDGVTSIGDSAFSSCAGLTSIVIPNSVTNIGKGAFYSNIKDITISQNVLDTAKLSGIFYINSIESITFDEKVTNIGDNAFSSLRSLKTIKIPDSVKAIGNSAFESCGSLTDITIPHSVKSVGDFAFYGCESLESLRLEDGIESIGNAAFASCTMLSEIAVPQSVKSIGGYAFVNTAYYKDSNNWKDDALYSGNCLLEVKSNVRGDFTVREGTRLIADYAFSGCSEITGVLIPDSVVGIGESAFRDNANLKIGADRASYAYEYAKSHSIQFVEKNGWIGSISNPIVSVEVQNPDVIIIENTYGKQLDGYYYYLCDGQDKRFIDIECIVNYKDGEKQYSYAYIDIADIQKQKTEPWTVGNTYKVKAFCEGAECFVNVTIIENPIAKVEIEDITIDEVYINQRWNLENYPKYMVTLKDGTVLTPVSSSAFSNAVFFGGTAYELYFKTEPNDRGSLTAGSYKIEDELAGIKVAYNLNVTENPFNAIYVDDVTVRESYGYYYFRANGSAELKTGERIPLEDDWICIGDKVYSVNYKKDDIDFKSGETYELIISLGNCETTFKVTIPEKSTPDITKVELLRNPLKTDYTVGEYIDLDGAVIRLHFPDNTFEDIEIKPVRTYYIYSKKLSKYLSVCGYDGNGSTTINSSDIEKVDVKVYYETLEFQTEFSVTVKNNDWVSVTLSDYDTLHPKMTVVEKNGNSFTANIKYTDDYLDFGGGSPWGYNSISYNSVIYTDMGAFYVEIYRWKDGEKTFSNIYFDNKRVKSNTVEGTPISSVLDRKCCNYIILTEKTSYWEPGIIRYINGRYYIEKRVYLNDGICKTIRMSFDENLNVIDYDYKFITGDINGDGVVDIRDLVRLKKHFAAPAENDIPNDWLDVSEDGIINSADLAELRKIILLTK